MPFRLWLNPTEYQTLEADVPALDASRTLEATRQGRSVQALVEITAECYLNVTPLENRVSTAAGQSRADQALVENTPDC